VSGRELIVERNPGELRMALRENDRTVEVILERGGAGSMVGAVWTARVLRVEPGIGAFLDFGRERPAFLPLTGTPPVEGEALRVQVSKDAQPGKGPEVTRSIVFDDGLLALTPTQAGIAISRALTGGQRATLKAAVQSVVGDASPMPGVLVRSAAWAQADRLAASWAALKEEWRRVEERAAAPPPLRLSAPPDPVLRQVALFRPDTAIAGDPGTAAKLRGLLPGGARFTPRPFEAQGVEDDLARALSREIPIPGGALVVDEAEALTAIDVNGGGDRLALCLAAAREVAALLRLRDIGGLVVIDFPFIDQRDFRGRIDDALRQATSADRRPVDCLGWTRGGLYELTRRRGGASLAAQMLEPHRALLSVESAALAALRRVADAEGGRLRLVAAPEVVAWLAGEGADALAASGRPVTLTADAGYVRDRFDVTRE